MKNKADKLTKELFQKIGTESPSENFKHDLMDKIYSLEKSKSKAYEPILSKKALIWISSIAASLVAVLFLVRPSSDSLKFPFEFNFKPSFPNIDIPKLSLSFAEYNVPNIWFYIVLAFPVFFIFDWLSHKLLEK